MPPKKRSPKRARTALTLTFLCGSAFIRGLAIAQTIDLPPMLPPSSIARLQNLVPSSKKLNPPRHLNYGEAIGLQVDFTTLETQWTSAAILGLPGALEISDNVIDRGRQEVRSALKTLEESPVAPAMRAAQTAAWEFKRRFVPDNVLKDVTECLDLKGSEEEKIGCVLSKLPALGSETPFTSLPVIDQLIIVKSALALVPQQAPSADDFSRLTNMEFWAAGAGLFKAWNRVAESEGKILKQLKKDGETINAQLQATFADFDRRRFRLENDAKRIVELGLDARDPVYKRYVKNARALLQDQLTLEGMTNGLVPPSTINLAELPANLQTLGKQLTASSQNAIGILQTSARGALEDLIPSAEALPALGAQALGLPPEIGSFVNVLQGGDPTQLLTGPVLKAVGLPPELGGVAVALGTGNFVGAISGFADMAGISFGGLLGGGGGGRDMTQFHQELAAIRQQLAEISAKLDVIDRKLDALRELVIANHAEVMAKLEVLGEELDYIRRANRDALGKHTRNCDTLASRVKNAKNYSSLELSLTNEAVGPFVRCWETVEDTASQVHSNSVFTLGLSEGAQAARENYSRKFLAPHVQFFRDAFTLQTELERATLLLGEGPHTLKSVARRTSLISSSALLEGRQLFASEVLDPKKILDYEAVELFFESAILATSLRPFINLTTKQMVSLDCAMSEDCLKGTAIPNETQMMDVLEGCLKLAETGVAQTAVLDGDLVLPFAKEVIRDPNHQAYESLTQLMKQDEVFARNVALAVMSSVLAPIAKELEPAPAPPDGVSKELPDLDVTVLGSLYSFAVETASPAMMLRLVRSGEPGWDIDFFIRTGPSTPAKNCTHIHEGRGLLMRLPNGICLPVPQIADIQNGTLSESPDSQAFRTLRARVLEEIVTYNYRKIAPPQVRKSFDAITAARLKEGELLW